MTPAKPTNLERLDVVVMVRLDLTPTVNPDFARATNEYTLADSVLRSVLSKRLARVVVLALLGVDPVFVPLILGTISRSHLLRIGVTVRLRASGVDRTAFVTSATVALVSVSRPMSDFLRRGHEPAY